MATNLDDCAEITLTGVTAYPATPQVSLDFIANAITLANLHGTARIYYNFDGSADDHRVLVPNTPLAAFSEERRVARVWLRCDDAAALDVRAVVLASSGTD